MPLDSKLISECTHEYHKSFDRLSKLVLIVVEKLEDALKQSQILARVSGRVKSRDSLRKKLNKWSGEEKKSAMFANASDVFALVGDLAAVRVMTYVEQDRERVTAIAKELFASLPGHENFEYEIKENSPRIKGDDSNYYRATHLQVCLKNDELKDDSENLLGDHCELQVTSMLAHVWNEIEHDIVYKGDRSALSEEERSSLQSLGLLTQTGDNLIVSLINANVARQAANARKISTASQEITSTASLSEMLRSHYGENLFGKKLDLGKNAEALLQAIRHLELTQPENLFKTLPPAALHGVRKVDIPAFMKFSAKNGINRPRIVPDSCDLFLLALISKYCSELASQPHTARGPKPRQLALARNWEAFLTSR